jgi:hypothetical protein
VSRRNPPSVANLIVILIGLPGGLLPFDDPENLFAP